MDSTDVMTFPNNGGFAKKFFQHTIEQMVLSNIITGYTRDKLAGLLNSDNKKDYAKAKKHILDIISIHDTITEERKDGDTPEHHLPMLEGPPQQQKAKAKRGTK